MYPRDPSLVRLLAIALVPAFASASRADDPAVVGKWVAPKPWPVIGIHAAMMPSGEVLHYSFPGGGPGSVAMTWDFETQIFTETPVNTDVFCSGLSLLPNGRLLVTGGNDYGCQFQGRFDTYRFDPFTRTWTQGANLRRARWYPTNIRLADNQTLVVSGLNRNCATTPVMEVIKPGQDPQIVPGGERYLSLYPWMHLLSDGRVAHVGPEAETYTFDPANPAWTYVTNANDGYRFNGTSVLVPNQPDAVLAIGGTSFSGVTNTVERIDFNDDPPAWEYASAMSHARQHANAVILPDGNVFVIGGGLTNEYEDPVLIPEMYDPDTDTWTEMAPHVYSRMYHSTAVLLPSGRVLCAGQDLGESALFAEVYRPPYLFHGPRPVIGSAPAVVHYGQTFAVQTAQAAEIASVVLIAPSNVTHSVNTGQRYVPLAFTINGSNELLVTAPSNPNAAPRGYYMLFILNDLEVPSRAVFVRMRP